MDHLLEQTLDKFKDIVKKPEKFLSVQSGAFDNVKILSKVLYDMAKVEEGEEDASKRDLSTLPALIIEDFDEEQIWAGVDLQNKAKFQCLKTEVENVHQMKAELNLLIGQKEKKEKVKQQSILFDDQEDEEEEEEEEQDLDFNEQQDDEQNFDENDEYQEDEEEGDDDDEEEEENQEEDDNVEELDPNDPLNDPDFQNMSDSDGDDLPLFENEGSDEEENYDNESKKSKRKAKAQNKDAEEQEPKGRTTQVDDMFFKMAEMEKFLEKEDANEERKRIREEKGLDKDDDENEDDIDLFDDLGGGDDQEDENAKYIDYFFHGDKEPEGDQDEAEEEDENEEQSSELQTGRKRSLLESDEESEETDLGEVKSTHEERQLRLQKKIKRMESEALKEKDWQMKGEIASGERPENALLEEDLEFDSVAKPAPIITEEVSKRLDDIIKQRIKDKAWDDVERKIKPREDPYEYKKKLVLDQEKSKQSLSQIYEEEYLKQKNDVEEKKKVPGLLDDEPNDTPELVEEIKKNMNNLFAKLDTLTHYHYTPRQLSAEVKIVRNMPTISMEEVAPVGMTDSALLAPQEIVDKKRGVPIENEEKSDTDRKRERRKKKKVQRDKRLNQEKKEKLVNKLNPGLGNKYSKKKMMKDIENAEKQGHLTTIKDTGKSKSVKSSSAFFEQLQNDVQTHISDKRTNFKKKEKKAISGAKLKL